MNSESQRKVGVKHYFDYCKSLKQSCTVVCPYSESYVTNVGVACQEESESRTD